MIIFESFPSPERHLDRLFVLSQLFSLQSVRPESSRVLEIGCSNAGQLFALAQSFPEAELFGIDNSEEAISEAIQRKEELAWLQPELMSR